MAETAKAGRKCIRMVSKVNGIVIKETDAGETGKRIVVLTKEHGKMLLSARGAKNTKSGIMAAHSFFHTANFRFMRAEASSP